VYALDQTSEHWAIIQNNIGTILSGEATTMKGQEGQRTLVKAVNALRQAVKASQSSWRRTATQYNLATALSQQGRLMGGEEGRKLFVEAVSLFRNAIAEYERERSLHELEWVSTKNNLGHALQGEAAVADPSEVEGLLAEAVSIFREVIDAYAHAQLPQEWELAKTQKNLGDALIEQGKHAIGGDSQGLFGEAVTAYREALKLESRQESPQAWAEIQFGLGTALEQQGLRLGGEEEKKLLAEAVDAFNEALTVCAREQMREIWAETQINLGVALAEQARLADGIDGQRVLNEAVDAFQAALKVCTREHMPEEWAMAQCNLGLVFMKEYELEHSNMRGTILDDAIAALRNALGFYTEKNDPQARESVINRLNEALALQAKTENGLPSTK
jgi:tetratricopeptide (TPR) repeat protein